jgi:hypothetical protein
LHERILNSAPFEAGDTYVTWLRECLLQPAAVSS